MREPLDNKRREDYMKGLWANLSQRPASYIPENPKEIADRIPREDDSDPGKRYKVGMYGGKFLPFHKGHAHCIDVASSECDILYVVLFYDILEGMFSEKLSKERGVPCHYPSEMKCNVHARTESILDYIATKEDNIKLIRIYRTVLPNGEEDWYAEAEQTKNAIGRKIDAVYSSEPSYSDFFTKAYPQAVHRLIDPERKEVPISGTKIRSMDPQEAQKWIM